MYYRVFREVWGVAMLLLSQTFYFGCQAPPAVAAADIFVDLAIFGVAFPCLSSILITNVRVEVPPTHNVGS
jgi:hypothetical protein